jgi:hypothetical protein
MDLRGAGLSSKPEGIYTSELLAGDVAAFMQAAGIGSAISSGCPWARRPACGWRPSTRTG